ncbi:cytochrome P450 [Coniochaeta sp. 2T2.1]|nr:cytochrome P450 [Coniochaeta sp. 2T2.1]
MIATRATPVLAALVVIFISYHVFLYPAFLSPLAKIPNAHWSAPYSRLWALHIRFTKRENRTLLAAHKRLGPVLRVAPNELSIDDVDCVRTVYSGGFDKPVWYSVFNNYGVTCMFSTRPSRDHAIRKRMISNVYSKSYIHASIAESHQAQTILFDRLLPIIQASTTGTKPHGIDVHSLFLATTMDFISCYVFGTRHGTNFIQQSGFRDHWLELYKSRNDYGFYDQELPWLTRLCRIVGIPLCPSFVDYANGELEKWLRDIVAQTLPDQPSWTNLPQVQKPVVMAALVDGHTKNPSLLSNPSSQHYIDTLSSELLDHVLAGQETAGVTLSYLTWRLSKDLSLQHKLRQELLPLSPHLKFTPNATTPTSLPDPKALDALPLLHAVVTETLRLHAPIPGPQPRETPSQGCSLGGYEVPGAVRVAAMAYTLHRDESVFPESEAWDYTRWVPGCASEEQMKARKRAFWAFSSGGRMCVGSNFAMHEMKLIVAAIYSNYTTDIVDDDGVEEQSDGYTSRPEKERLYLRFERVE